jgi:chromate transport protein ChrA
MVTPSGAAVFYAVFIAPGFIAVMTAVSLAAIESDISQFVLLIWSLVSSLLIDTVFLAVYQWVSGPVESASEITGVLFETYFRADYILAILVLSVVVGIGYAAAILLDVPGRGRGLLQYPKEVTYNPRQPWPDFMRDAKTIRIKTSDDELYAGEVVEWSRAGRSRQIRVSSPDQYNKYTHEFEPIELDDMLFLEDDIDRIVIWERDSVVSSDD